jgi:conjugal transfer pilin signal peptidase TrbI
MSRFQHNRRFSVPKASHWLSHPALIFWIRSLTLLTLVLWFEIYAGKRFLIGGDNQKDKCLPDHFVYLIDTYDKDIRRGDLVAFRSNGMTPFFRDGTIVIKIAAGIAGDTIEVDPEQITINGEEQLKGLPLAQILKQPVRHYVRKESLQDGQLFVIGKTDRSFDSRYLGPIQSSQVIGKAYAIY